MAKRIEGISDQPMCRRATHNARKPTSALHRLASHDPLGLRDFDAEILVLHLLGTRPLVPLVC